MDNIVDICMPSIGVDRNFADINVDSKFEDSSVDSNFIDNTFVHVNLINSKFMVNDFLRANFGETTFGQPFLHTSN